MTHNEARQMLSENDAAIQQNVNDYFAGRIDHATFTARQQQYHDAIDAAGQADTFCRRWRAR